MAMKITAPCLAAALTALPFSAISQGLTATPSGSWKSLGGGAYSLDFSAPAKGELSFGARAEPESFYKISCLASSNLSCAEADLVFKLSAGAKASHSGRMTSAKPAVFYQYVYVDKADSLNMALFFNQGAPRSFEVKSLAIEKLRQKDLDGNLLVDGDFESPGDRPVSWVKRYQTKRSEASIAPDPEFISGKRCMAVDFRTEANGALGGFESICLPVRLGGKYELKLWAKSEKPFAFSLGVQAWSIFGHKGGHFHSNADFRAKPEWKLFSLRIEVPKDLSKYPDLADRSVSITINGLGGEPETRVLFDNISLSPTQSAP